jgi:putative flippase GtrA
MWKLRWKERENWEIVLGFAAIGLAATAVSYVIAVTFDSIKPDNVFTMTLALVSIIICPAQLPFAACIDCEVNGWDGVVMFAIIGVLNVAIYMVIGYLVSRSRKPGPINESG